ncbi:hypothetical protein Tco_0556324 [Tanacetum coccineum]
MAETYTSDRGEKFSGACWLLPTFCEGLPPVSLPLTSADEKGEKFVWTRGVMRFLRLKGDWCQRPILTLIGVSVNNFPRRPTPPPQPSGQANVVADALSRKSGMIACFDSMILHDLERLDVELCVRGSGGYWASMRIESNLMLQIKEAQRDDGELWAIVQNVEDGKHTEFSVDDDSVVWFEDRC